MLKSCQTNAVFMGKAAKSIRLLFSTEILFFPSSVVEESAGNGEVFLSNKPIIRTSRVDKWPSGDVPFTPSRPCQLEVFLHLSPIGNGEEKVGIGARFMLAITSSAVTEAFECSSHSREFFRLLFSPLNVLMVK